mgnify:CR=1 FL=1
MEQELDYLEGRVVALIARIHELENQNGRFAEVLEFLKTEKPPLTHVVLTGRDCPPEIVEIADTVSEVKKIKHAYEAGIPAQRGIED